jgi:hypothetical protein
VHVEKLWRRKRVLSGRTLLSLSYLISFKH